MKILLHILGNRMGRNVYDQVLNQGFKPTLITSFSSQELNFKFFINFFYKHNIFSILLSLWATLYWLIFNRIILKYQLANKSYYLLNRLTLMPIIFFQFDLVYVLDKPDLWILRKFKSKGSKIILEQAIFPNDHKSYIEVLKIADIILCPSKNIYQLTLKLIEKDRNNIKCEPYLIDYTSGSNFDPNLLEIPKDLLKFTNLENHLKLLFVGNDPERKGLNEIIDTVQKFNNDIKNKIILIIVGNINLNKYYTKDKNIIFIGSKPNKIVRWLMTKSDLLVMLSKAEGSPIVLHEALDNNLPFITTLECGDIVSACSNLVVRRDYGEFYDLLIKINQDNEILLKAKKNMELFLKNKNKNETIGELLAKLFFKNKKICNI